MTTEKNGQSRRVRISADVEAGGNAELLVIAGPCQIESTQHCLKIAEHLMDLQQRYGFQLIFKSSYDKANRTSLGSQRGPGIKKGLEILAEVKEKTGLPLLTDVHSPKEAELASHVVDVLQTPAFLCRQTDLLVAVGEAGRAVNIKKGQFLAPEDMRYAVEKVSASGNHNLLLCERGTCFGYRDLVVDMRNLVVMKELGYPVIFDATHSVQQMGAEQGSSGGSRSFISHLTRAAAAVGIDGLFIECHEEPAKAPSDSAVMLPLNELEELIKSVTGIRKSLSD